MSHMKCIILWNVPQAQVPVLEIMSKGINKIKPDKKQPYFSFIAHTAPQK